MTAEENLNSALEKALQCLSHFGLLCELCTEQTKVIYSLVSGGGDLPAILSNALEKGLIFQWLVHVKEILTGKTSSVKILLLV